MGSSASQSKNKLTQIKPSENNDSKQVKENLEFSPLRQSAIGTPRLAHMNSPIIARRSPIIRSQERILDTFSTPLNDKLCGQSSAQNSEISEQDQVPINNNFRPRKASKFQDKKFSTDHHFLTQRDQIPFSQKNIFLQQQKEFPTSRSIGINEGKINPFKLNVDSHTEDYNLKDNDGNHNQNEVDNYSKFSNNDTSKNNDRTIPSNIYNHIQQFNKKLTHSKQKSESNLFSNEADFFFKKKDLQKDEEKNQNKAPGSALGTQIQNNLHAGAAPDNINQRNPNNNKITSQTQQQNQQLGNLIDDKDEFLSKKELAEGFKHEVIQIAKHKSNKEFFKKGNVYLLVQDENSVLQKKLNKNNQQNIISDLITNNISVTEFLVSDKEDIQEQILMSKQKKKMQIQQMQQIQESNTKQKQKRKYKVVYGNQISSNQDAADAQNQENSNKNTINQQTNNYQMQEQQNIIFSYNSDWETIRNRGALQSSVK